MRRLVRAAGVALVVFGLVGAVLTLGLLVVGGEAVAQAEQLSTTADASVEAASRSLTDAATAFGGFDTSLEEAQDSAGQAAGLARDTAATMSNLAAAMSITVFGAQPFVALAADFERGADQLDELGTSLDRIGANLGANRDQMSAVSRDLGELAAQVELLDAATTEPPALRLLLYLLTAWLALPSLGALVGGAWLLGWRRAEAA
jgi:hypothetical protein